VREAKGDDELDKTRSEERLVQTARLRASSRVRSRDAPSRRKTDEPGEGPMMQRRMVVPRLLRLPL
jgi:hypothetical protein